MYNKLDEIFNSYSENQTDEAVDAVYEFYLTGQGNEMFEIAYDRWLKGDIDGKAAPTYIHEFQERVDRLQTIKDKLEGKSDADNAPKVRKASMFFVNEIDKMMDTYMKTVYDSTL